MSEKPTIQAPANPNSSAPASATSPLQTILDRLRRGEVGQLPVVLALILIAAYFQIKSPYFLTSRNLSNLVLQNAEIGCIALGAVLVLLIGEIDLSLATVSYLCGAYMVTLSVYHHWSAVAALLAALVIGAIVGAINGFFVAILRVPSFIVTLAGSLFYAGLLLHILLPNTTIILFDPTLTGIATNFIGFPTDYIIGGVVVAVYLAAQFISRGQRAAGGLTNEPLWSFWTKIVLVAVLVIGAVTLFEDAYGAPYSALILLGVIALFWLILRFTAFGKHVYAVGGNAEAARRAGINVAAVRIVIFTLASTLAGLAGILEASRTASGSPAVPATLELDAIAAAVIGGVSLFGGRGSPWAVVLGVLIIGSLENGIALLGLSQDIQFMIEGAVLIIAVTADALLRRRNATGVR